MSDITFRGVKASSLGLVVSKMPDRGRAKWRTDEQVVPGRSGKLHLIEDAYEQITLKASLNCFGRANLDKALSWLSGYGDLILSDAPDRRYKALAIAEVSAARDRPMGKNYDEISVSFECDPFQYEKSPETIPIYRSSQTFNNIGTGTARPTIKVIGSGEAAISVAGIRVLLSGLSGTVTIDCDAMLAYSGENGARVSITLLDEEWPKIAPGEFTVTRNEAVSKIELTPNYCWL